MDDPAMCRYEGYLLGEAEKTIHEMQAEITRLRAELAKEGECVDWYAEPGSWTEDPDKPRWWTAIDPMDVAPPCFWNNGKTLSRRQARPR